MGYRERIAWLTLSTMLVAYGIYFGVVGPAAAFGQRRLIDIVWTFGPVAIGHAVALIVGSIALAALSSGECRAPADERDRAIVRRSSIAGYYVLLAGMVLVGVVMPFSEPSWKIVNAALAAVVVAEAVRYAVILWSYRRGWLG